MRSNSDQGKLKMTHSGVGPVYEVGTIMFVTILSIINIYVLPTFDYPTQLVCLNCWSWTYGCWYWNPSCRCHPDTKGSQKSKISDHGSVRIHARSRL